ncbi:MAG: OmpA family protein [Georgfuchsia sp.]
MNKKHLRRALSQVILFAGFGLLLASCATTNNVVSVVSRGPELSTESQPSISPPLPVSTAKLSLKRSIPTKLDQTSSQVSSIFQLPDPAATVFFLPGSSAISKDSFAVINTFAEKLNNNARSKVLLIGHADDLTSDEYCIALSGKRITVVEAELIRRGVKQAQIRKRPLGGESLISKDCASKLCRQANRSVELQLSG